MNATHKIKHLEGCRHLFKIEVPKDDITSLYDEVYKKIQKETALPGFRKGKAPIELLKQDYKEYAKKKVLELAVEDSYSNAMRSAGLSPVGMPHIENVKFAEGSGLSFDATVEAKPKVDVKNYKALKIKKKPIEVKDDDIQKALENLRQLAAQYKTIEPRPVQEGDFILCNLEWLVDGNPIEKKEMVMLEVEKKTLTADVFGGILGSIAGEKKSISINIDKNFHRQEYVGKTGVLEVLIHQIKQKELPALDDEFAKDLGITNGLTVLKENLKTHLESEKKEQVRLDMQDQAIERLLKSHSFHLPQSLVEAEYKGLFDDAKEKLLSQGYSESQAKDILEKEKQPLETKFKDHAEKQVKTFFILEDIAEKEGLNATEQEVDELIEDLAKRQKKNDVKEFKRQLEKADKLNSLYWQLTEAKAMGFLLDNAKIEEEVHHE